MPATDIGSLRELLNAKVAKGDHSGWDDAWAQNLTPWDRQGAQPALLWALQHSETSQYLPKDGGKALIAGCGRGYDAEVFAKQGYSPSIGVDVSPVAVEKARQWFEEKGSVEHKDAVKFVEADFFKLGSSDGAQDVGTDVAVAYDYTFFCALPPTLRKDWATTYIRVIRSGGILICVVFPIQGDRPDGPPVSTCATLLSSLGKLTPTAVHPLQYSVHPQMYKDLLSSDFDLLWEGVPQEQQPEKAGVLELQIWRRK